MCRIGIQSVGFPYNTIRVSHHNPSGVFGFFFFLSILMKLEFRLLKKRGFTVYLCVDVLLLHIRGAHGKAAGRII